GQSAAQAASSQPEQKTAGFPGLIDLQYKIPTGSSGRNFFLYCQNGFVKGKLAQKEKRTVVKNAQKGPLEPLPWICQGARCGGKSSKCRNFLTRTRAFHGRAKTCKKAPKSLDNKGFSLYTKSVSQKWNRAP